MYNAVIMLERAFQITDDLPLPSNDPFKQKLDAVLDKVNNLVEVEIFNLLRDKGYISDNTSYDVMCRLYTSPTYSLEEYKKCKKYKTLG